MTRGTTSWSATSTAGSPSDHVAGQAGLVLAHVGQERPAVAVADGVEPAAVAPRRAELLVHLDVASGLEPDQRRGRGPRWRAGGRRRRGARRPRRRARRPAWRTGPPSPARHADARDAGEHLDALGLERRPTSSPAKGSSRPSSRAPPSITVTSSEPSRRNAWAISPPIAPPPSTRSRRGTAWPPWPSGCPTARRRADRRRAGSPARCRWPARPPSGGQRRRRPSAPSTSDHALPSRRPCPGRARCPSPSSHGTWPSSFQSLVM